MTNDERSRDSIWTLEAEFRNRVLRWWKECKEKGIELLIYCGYRSPEEQDKLYAQGRKAKGKIVTHARAGESFHNYGRAIDYVPLINGKVAWEAVSIYRKAQVIGRDFGLRSLSWELPHLEDALASSWRVLAKTPKIEQGAPYKEPASKTKPKTRKIGGRGLR